ncbi:regulatory protein RecX [Chthonobacter albigriseus]|uniref:regulatory protein RecX n=1 Tax=Chthonobacter albigriseus TaxID=1683161 RepID=UPI0015EEA308|nr:RecX family transcriptional regulator [Chthonobacter albigriseus]
MNDSDSLSTPLDRAWLRRAAFHYLERYATSEANLERVLRRKIARRHPDPPPAEVVADAIAVVLDACRDLGLLNDAGFAEMKAASGRRKGMSAKKLVGVLTVKGIDRAAAEQAVAQAEGDDRQAAIRFARRRRLGPWQTRPGDDRHQKDIAALCRAGFGYGLAREVAGMTADEAEAELAAPQGDIE